MPAPEGTEDEPVPEDDDAVARLAPVVFDPDEALLPEDGLVRPEDVDCCAR